MLKDKILDLMNRSDFMTLSTSVAGNSSAANVYFANDGLDIYFFTFNPSRKAVHLILKMVGFGEIHQSKCFNRENFNYK